MADELKPLNSIIPNTPAVRPATHEAGVKADEGYAYHSTNAENLHDIAQSGKLATHKPSHGTDQDAWPDGATEKRAYFSHSPDIARSFSPAEGRAVLMRTKRDADMHTEKGTGDLYTKRPVRAMHLEYHGDDKNWHPVARLKTPAA